MWFGAAFEPCDRPPAMPPANRSPSDRPRGSVRCGGCSASYEHPGWLALQVVGVLTSDAIAEHVVKWPSGVRIEIRRCTRCGKSIARTEDP